MRARKRFVGAYELGVHSNIMLDLFKKDAIEHSR